MAFTLNPFKRLAGKARKTVNNAVVDKAVDTVVNKHMTPEEITAQILKMNVAKVDRAEFLNKELKGHYPEETVQTAIEYNPAYAGIDKQKISRRAYEVIQRETKKVSGISFAAGLPGGYAMAATVPAEMIQYFAYTVRAIQELAYLYGFDEFDLKEGADSYGMHQILVLLGAMYDIQGADESIRVIAEADAQKKSKELANEALTKEALYPVVKKITEEVRTKIAKRMYVKSASKIVPVIGGAVSGRMTYNAFKENCTRLKDCLSGLELCDVGFYEKIRSGENQEDKPGPEEKGE